MKKTVLISGASIAGLTMAYWMNRYGYEVTVVELAAKPRQGGSPIDVRGDALDVAERMGILDRIQQAKLATEGLEFVNARNEVQGTMLVDEIGAERPGEDIELRRDLLVSILYETAGNEIEYLFCNSIQQLVQTADEVTVTFKDGITRPFDYVFGADGVHSAVRRLVFGDEQQFTRFLGLYFTILEVDETLGRKNHGRMFSEPGKMATIYSYSNKADCILVFRSPELQYNYRDTAEQKQLVTAAFAQSAWKIPEILTTLNQAENIYFDQVCQIRMPSWSSGRVALIGDAAHCAAFPTGMGSSLAMLGATILADQLVAANGDYARAFSAYDSSFRPFVETVQETVFGGIEFLVPETAAAIDARNAMAN
jgi:2-polyprenyl-6-methoxyphenol hydroxylase-like FAD-dependent oxidoreductase